VDEGLRRHGDRVFELAVHERGETLRGVRLRHLGKPGPDEKLGQLRRLGRRDDVGLGVLPELVGLRDEPDGPSGGALRDRDRRNEALGKPPLLRRGHPAHAFAHERASDEDERLAEHGWPVRASV
jgi:hypothetical protein